VSQYVRGLTFVTFIVSVLSHTSAEASPITWLLEGTVFTTGGLPGIAVGDPASMLLTFESSTPDSDPSPDCGLYLGANMSANSTFGSQTFVANDGLGIEVSRGTGSVVNCGIMPGNNAGYTFRVGQAPYLIAFFEDGLPVFVPSDALPLVPPNIDLFDSGIRMAPIFSIGAGGGPIAHLNSARAVPEPATALLVGSGLMAAAIRRRRSKPRN
jgi:PEP-CTERM motif-containing protein